MAIIGTLPFNIMAGQLISAAPVMSNYNYIANQVNANALPNTGPATFTGSLTVTGILNITAAGAGVLNATASLNGIQSVIFQNSSTGASAESDIYVESDTGIFRIQVQSNAFGSGLTRLFAQSNTGLNLGTNNADRITINNAGNVVINSPTSGTALVITGLAGTTHQAIQRSIDAASSDISLQWGTATFSGYLIGRANSGNYNSLVASGDQVIVAAGTGSGTGFLTLTALSNVAAGIRIWNTGRCDITGTQTNDSASTGLVGEFVTAASSSTALTSNTVTNTTSGSISLTAGDWDVSGIVGLTPTGNVTVMQGDFNTTSATFSANFVSIVNDGTTLNAASTVLALPTRRISLSATTTVFGMASCTFSTGTCNASTTLFARRVR